MKKVIKKSKSIKNYSFAKEYNKIINSSKNSVVIESEWSREGDYFKKFSMYDNNYTFIPTLGGTTLISHK